MRLNPARPGPAARARRFFSGLCLFLFALLLPLLGYLAWLGLVEEQAAPDWQNSDLLREPDLSVLEAEAALFAAVLRKEYLRAESLAQADPAPEDAGVGIDGGLNGSHDGVPGGELHGVSNGVPGGGARAVPNKVQDPEERLAEAMRRLYGVLRPDFYALLWKGGVILSSPLVPDLEGSSLTLVSSGPPPGTGPYSGPRAGRSVNLGRELAALAGRGGGHYAFTSAASSSLGQSPGLSSGQSGGQSNGKPGAASGHYLAYALPLPGELDIHSSVFLSVWRESDFAPAILPGNVFYIKQFRYGAALLAGSLLLLGLLLRQWPEGGRRKSRAGRG